MEAQWKNLSARHPRNGPERGSNILSKVGTKLSLKKDDCERDTRIRKKQGCTIHS